MYRHGLRIAAVGLACGAVILFASLNRRLTDDPRAAAWAAEAVKVDEGDNTACLCCHIDFDGEEIVDKHLAAKITCRSCHGASEHHRLDETLVTRPDLLWGRAEVDGFCRQCHEKHENDDAVERFQQEWLNKARPNGRFIGPDAVCTDCHGEHTIPHQR
jgi:hypothetical protein